MSRKIDATTLFLEGVKILDDGRVDGRYLQNIFQLGNRVAAVGAGTRSASKFEGI